MRPVDGRARSRASSRSSRKGARRPASRSSSRARTSCARARKVQRAGEPARRAEQGRAERRRRGAAVSISEPFIRRPVATTLLMIGLLLAGLVGYRAAAGLGAAAGRLPDHRRLDLAARRERRDDGLGGDDAARAAVRADAVARADDVGVELRQLADHAAVRRSTATSTPPSRTCRRRSTPRRTCCRARCRRRRPTARATPPTRRSSRSRVSSDTLPLQQVDDYADSILAQKISQVSGVGLVTLNGGQKPAVRVQVDPGGARRAPASALEDVRAALVAGQRQPAQGQPRRPAPGLHARRPTISSSSADGVRAADPRLQERRAGAAARRRRRRRRRRERAARRLGRRASAPIILNVQRQPGANVIEVAERVKALLPQLEASLPQGDRRDDPLATAPRRCAPRCDDVQFTLRPDDRCWWSAVIYVFLRSAARDRHPRRRGAAVADRHVRRDVPARLQPRTTCR